MRRWLIIMVFCVVAVVLGTGLLLHTASANMLSDREKARQEANQSVPGNVQGLSATVDEVRSALDISVAAVVSSSLSLKHSSQVRVFSPGLGVISPREGNSFFGLSTGIAGTNTSGVGGPSPRSGTQHDLVNADINDLATYTVRLVVPPTSNQIAFDWRFLSAEYPEFVGAFNDGVSIKLVRHGTGTTTEIAFDEKEKPIDVNSSDFKPGYSSIVGATGFDIVLPSSVFNLPLNKTYQAGFPAAGATEWKTITAAVTPGEEITLTFSIWDRTDRIFDSLLLLDNFRFLGGTALSVTDYRNSKMFTKKIVADGVARLKIEAGGATISLSTGSASNGKLSTSAVGGYTTSSVSGSVLYYQAPEDFAVVSGDFTKVSRTVTLNGTVGSTATNLDLTIIRPPLVLMHGIWSSSAMWDNLLYGKKNLVVTGGGGITMAVTQDVREGGFRQHFSGQVGVIPVNNKVANNFWEVLQTQGVPIPNPAEKWWILRPTLGDESFKINADALSSQVASLLARMRDQDVAVEQVDFVGHSMGGILGRILASEAYDGKNYGRRDDINPDGVINRLITIHTPHLGTDKTRLLIEKWNNSLPGSVVSLTGVSALGVSALGFTYGNINLTAPALSEMVWMSNAIMRIPALDRPIVHLIEGNISSLPLEANIANGIFHTALPVGQVLSAGGIWDLVVARQSQRGGKPAGGTAVTPSGLSHTSVHGDDAIHTTVLSLLNSSLSSNKFTALSKPGDFASNVEAQGISGLSHEGEPHVVNDTTLFRIAAPTAGVTLIGGDTVLINLFAHGSIAPETVTFGAAWLGNVNLSDTSAPFQVIVRIDTTFVGTAQISASGQQSDTLYFNAVQVIVRSPASLTALLVSPNPASVTKGSQVALTVYGIFGSDTASPILLTGVGAAAYPLTYSSEDTSIATVNESGVVSGVETGNVSVRVAYQDTATLVGVQVVPPLAALSLSSSSSPAAAAPSAKTCLIQMVLGSNFPLMQSSLRGMRDGMLSTTLGRMITSLYYSQTIILLFMIGLITITLFSWIRINRVR